MKFAIVLALVGYAAAGVVQYGAPVGVGLLTSGTSSQFRSQDNIGNYAFGYNEDHSTGGTFRREQGGPGVMVGSYGLRDIDGRTRVVNYVADAGGYRANIQTNEPGVEPKDPAAVLINKAQAIVGPALAAPLAAPIANYAAVAPLAVHAPVSHSSYSVSTQHVAAPAIAHYAAAPLAAPLIAHAGPVASYATKTVHAASPYLSHVY
jgi:hypothetical protein